MLVCCWFFNDFIFLFCLLCLVFFFGLDNVGNFLGFGLKFRKFEFLYGSRLCLLRELWGEFLGIFLFFKFILVCELVLCLDIDKLVGEVGLNEFDWWRWGGVYDLDFFFKVGSWE